MDPLSCGWDTAKYFIFSDNVFGSLVYYSHFFALIPSLIIGLLIFLKNPKGLMNRILFAITFLFSVWVFSDVVLWANEKIDFQMFFWSLQVIIEPIIYALSLYFIYVFITKNDISLGKKFFISILLFPTLIFASTKFALVGFDLSNCDREVTEGPITLFGYLIEIIYVFWILIFAIKSYFKAGIEMKKQIKDITLGIIFFLLSLSFGNIIGSFTDNWTIGQIGLFGMPIFVGFLAYMIVRFNLFNIKIFITQILVFSLGFLVLSILFIRHIENIQIVVTFTLVFIITLGFILIKSVKKEIEQREKLQILSVNLEDANEKLQSLDKLKTEFLSLASHQLRSPLTAIIGYTSMLLDGSFGKISDKQKEAIDRVFQSSRHLSTTVEDLLNVSKIEQGGMQYVKVPFDFEKASGDLAKDLSVTAEKKGLKLTFETDGKSPYTVNGDMEKIRQVILNFIDNSIKYTKEGSINVLLSKNEGAIRLSIKDTGMGMTPEIKAKLFQKFARAEGGKMNAGGSGLGLYLAKKIIEEGHNGKVGVDSEGMNKGSTFWMELQEA